MNFSFIIEAMLKFQDHLTVTAIRKKYEAINIGFVKVRFVAIMK